MQFVHSAKFEKDYADGLRLMPGQLHGHAERDASPLQIVDGGTAEVMRDHTRYASRLARFHQSRARVPNPFAVPMEYQQDDVPVCCFRLSPQTPRRRLPLNLRVVGSIPSGSPLFSPSCTRSDLLDSPTTRGGKLPSTADQTL